MSGPYELIDFPATIVHDDGAFIQLRLPRCLLVLTKAEFVAGLKRGKAWKRHAAFLQRHEGGGEADGSVG